MPKAPPEPTLDDLITRAETAQLYGVAEPTISAWLYRRDPRLPQAIRIGHNYLRFRRGDVLERIRALAEGNVILIAVPSTSQRGRR